jgi:hypothetical protein
MDLKSLLALNVTPTQIPITDGLRREKPETAALLKLAQTKGGWFSFTEEEAAKYCALGGFWLKKLIDAGAVLQRADLGRKRVPVQKFDFTLKFIELTLDAATNNS